MVGISKSVLSLLISQIVTNIRDPKFKEKDKLDISRIKTILEEQIMRIPNLQYSWGEPTSRISERLMDICYILTHLEDNMPMPLKKYFGVFMSDVYQVAARCRTTNDFIERVNLLATHGTGFKAILYSGIAYELGRLFNMTPYYSRQRSRIERKIFDEIEMEVYKPQLGVHSEPLRRMCNEGPSSISTLDIADEEFRILEDNYWVYTTELGDRKLVCPTPTLVSGDLIWAGVDYLCQKNPSPDVMNVDFVKLLKKIISSQIFEMDGLPSRLFMLGTPQKIKFLDCLFEEDVLRVKTAFGPHPIIESELLNHDVAGGIAYIIKSLKNEICIKSIYIMNLAAKHLYSDEEFFRDFCSFKKRRELGKSVLYTSGLETFLLLSSLCMRMHAQCAFG